MGGLFFFFCGAGGVVVVLGFFVGVDWWFFLVVGLVFWGERALIVGFGEFGVWFVFFSLKTIRDKTRCRWVLGGNWFGEILEYLAYLL